MINLDNPGTPTGPLTGITVNGDDPTGTGSGGNTLIVNGTTDQNDIFFDPTGPEAGSITGAQPVPVTFTTIEQVEINGQGDVTKPSAGDTLNYVSPANTGLGSVLTYTPGATPDAGTITGTENEGGPMLVPLYFDNLDEGLVEFMTANPGGTRHAERQRHRRQRPLYRRGNYGPQLRADFPGRRSGGGGNDAAAAHG